MTGKFSDVRVFVNESARNPKAMKDTRCQQCAETVPKGMRYVSITQNRTEFRYCEPCYWEWIAPAYEMRKAR